MSGGEKIVGLQPATHNSPCGQVVAKVVALAFSFKFVFIEKAAYLMKM